MRIGNPTNNEYFLELNQINEKIQVEFLKKITYETRTVDCNVMLGDSTTKIVQTFDIKNMETFFGCFDSKLSSWNSQGVTSKYTFCMGSLCTGNRIFSQNNNGKLP